MRYSIRPMREEDIPQVAEIDREAFPTQWPYPSYAYRRELNNRLASYIVAVEDGVIWHSPGDGFKPLSQLMNLIRRKPGKAELEVVEGKECIAGFAGIWRMLDEAHLTTIAVRKDHRGRGVGELLLNSVFDVAMQFNSSAVTLEVRVSNTVAQSLYRKYGFKPAGVRRGYYSEDGEDGLVMTTDSITTQEFQTILKELREQHAKRMGELISLPPDKT
ncbi:MAG: ribosomal protein S18-alanine N-acetyltransferase [Chloroflexi bacterium]|nr:ribosomal protein S18-alanine N-acetyltransferase [Chloroflexota bacterium]